MGHESDTLTERRAGKYPYRIAQPAIPYGWGVSQGKIKDHFHINKFGYNATVGTTEETIWSPGGTYVYETTASIVRVSSTSVLDDDGAAGANTVQIYGLDQNYNNINEIITMNGQLDVLSANQYIRVFRVVVRSAGVSAGNVGTITVNNNADTNTMAQVEIGDNQTLMAVWTCPANYEGHIANFWAATASTQAAFIDLFVRPFGEVFQLKRRIVVNASYVNVDFPFTEEIPQKSDVELKGYTLASTAVVSGGFDVMYDR